MSIIVKFCRRAILGSALIMQCSPAIFAEEHPASSSVLDANPAQATANVSPQSPVNDPTWHFQSLSYLWFPGMHGTIGGRGYDTSVHISSADILKNTNIGIMGAFESDYKRWGIPIDYVWAKISDKHAALNFPGYSGKATIKEGFLTPKVSYLVLDGKMIKVRANAGIRIWHMGETLDITAPAPQPSPSFGASQNWVDVVAGANVVVPLSPKIFVMVLGDAGAGGANIDYQVAGMVNYQLKPKWGVGLGYRYVDVNYRNNNQVIIDTAQSGLALTLLYKYGKPK